jgi:hypothetical protein
MFLNLSRGKKVVSSAAMQVIMNDKTLRMQKHAGMTYLKILHLHFP